MDTLTIGSIHIPYTWVAFLAAIFVLEIVTKKRATWQIDSFLFQYILIWKLSYVLFYLKAFIQAPLSILYFDGGWKGHLLALCIVLITLIMKRQQIQFEDLWKGFILFLASYHIVIALLNVNIVLIILSLLASIVLFKKISWATALVGVIIFSQYDWTSPYLWSFVFLFVLFTFMKRNQESKQLIGLVFVSLLIGMMWDSSLKEMKTTEGHTTIMLQSVDDEKRTLHNPEKSLTIVNFFATWCGPCKAEMPHLQSFSQKLPDNVELVGVNLASRDHGETALNGFLQQYEVSYPILIDENDLAGKAYRILSIPTTVLLNEEGEELTRIVGPLSEEKLQNLVKKYAE